MVSNPMLIITIPLAQLLEKELEVEAGRSAVAALKEESEGVEEVTNYYNRTPNANPQLPPRNTNAYFQVPFIGFF